MDESDIPRIKVFNLSDESLKLLGELLTNESSRSIILALIENQMYVNQLAEKLDMRVSLVIHHLKKLGELGLLDIEEKPISKRTKDHKFFKINTDVFLSFTMDKTGNKLKRIFKNGIKFTSIGITSLFVWLYKINDPTIEYSQETTLDDPLTIPLIIIIIGLIVLLLKKEKK